MRLPYIYGAIFEPAIAHSHLSKLPADAYITHFNFFILESYSYILICVNSKSSLQKCERLLPQSPYTTELVEIIHID
jgi:hypothetical protein